MSVTEVAEWSHSDLVAAVASIIDERERCPGCGLTPDDAWHVCAELVLCPTCEDRDKKWEGFPEKASRAGWRSKFVPLVTEAERMIDSSASRYTLEGRQAFKRWRESQPARPRTVD
jgi:hypothetical protein